MKTTISILSIVVLLVSTGIVTANAVRTSHPRIFFNDDNLASLKDRAIQGDSDFESIKAFVIRRYDEFYPQVPDPDKPHGDIPSILRGNYPYKYMASIALVAALLPEHTVVDTPNNTQNHTYIDFAKAVYAWMIDMDPSDGWDTGTRNRILTYSVVYDWLFAYLSEAEKTDLRNKIVEHTLYPSLVDYYDPITSCTGNHPRWGNAVVLIGCLAVHGDDSRLDDVLPIVQSNWENCLNPFFEYVAQGGGHHMGWLYGSSYSSVEPYVAWYTATGELWLENCLEDWCLFPIYGTVNDKVPEFGDCWGNMDFDTEWYNICAVVAGLLKNPYAEDFYRNEYNWYYGPSRILRFVTKDELVTPMSTLDLPLSRLFQNSGFALSRNNWTEDAALLVFKSSPFFTRNHHHKDQNSFILSYKGRLLIDSGHYDSYGTDHWRNYYSRSIAHNTMVVYDPDETYFDFAIACSNDGGQQFRNLHNRDGGAEASDLDEVFQDEFSLDGITKHSGNDDVTWVQGDATKAYRTYIHASDPGYTSPPPYSNKVHKYVRDVVFVNNPEGSNLPYVFVVDSVDLSKELTPRILWHTMVDPDTHDNVYSIVWNAEGGYARLEYLAPADAVVTEIGGEGLRWEVDGVNYAPSKEVQGLEGDWGRIEVASGVPTTSETFATAIVLGDDALLSTPPPIPLSQLVEGEGWIGARIQDTLMVVATGNVNVITLAEGQGAGLTDAYIAGASPNSVVYLDAHDGLYLLNSDSKGLAYSKELISVGTPPVAVCTDMVVPVGTGGYSHVSIDGGSYDPDGDPITFEQEPTGPYAVGVYQVTLTVSDGAQSDSCQAMVVIYDPSGGFVTGGGWIWSPAGAYADDPSLEGKANFGFVSKYKKGANTPTGQTEFVFKAGDLDFHSSSYQWLVVNQGGTNAQFKGSGSINGAGDYKFMLWAKDDDSADGDTFRIKIWMDPDEDNPVYDNGFDQSIGGGSIKIHKN